jgi:hypothetical protein
LTALPGSDKSDKEGWVGSRRADIALLEPGMQNRHPLSVSS